MRKVLLVLSLAISILLFGLAGSQSSTVHTIKVDAEYIEAYTLLKQAEYFAYGGIGFGGEKPKELSAFSDLYSSPNAKTYFQMLVSEATLEGKLYALCALYYLDPEQYQTYLLPYLNSTQTVKCFIGCILDQIQVSHLIKTERTPVIHLNGANDSFAEWSARTPTAHTMSWYIDFYGGGYPATLKQYLENYK